MCRSLFLRPLAATAAAALLACGGAAPPETASSAVSTSAIDPGNAGGNKHLTVMTRNLFVGGDVLAPFLVPEDEVLAAAAQVWQDIQTSNFPARARAIAGEIEATLPDLVGLQEVYRFDVTSLVTGEPAQAPLDFLEELMAALAERGLAYGVVRAAPHTTVTIPFPTGVAVTMLDRDAVLARLDGDVELRGSASGDFVTRLPATLAGLTFDLTRGWVAAEVKKQGVPFLFVNSHLEVRGLPPGAPEGYVQALQAQELLGVVGSRERVILVGDFNSDADRPIAFWSYGLLAQAGFEDAWLAEHAPGSGLTCCFEPLRDPDAEPYERIDLVLHRGANEVLAVERVGATADALLHDALGPLWPSDHAGVVATFRLESPRFAGLEASP